MSEVDRSQMVLLAIVAIAVALVPMLLAYMQPGNYIEVGQIGQDYTIAPTV